ncbi:MAG TPA: zinc ribbon domain-containing protein [Thermoplasmata archaeon]|nr:zinc ribbon domain-containing protein [Thermoplasmata archaeon]
MAGVDPFVELVIAVIAVAIVVPTAVYLLRSYRQRRLRAMRDEASDPGVASDRAFNRIALARREADLWDVQGGDTEQARQLIDLANRSLQTREFDRAYSLAQAAHETLVKAREGPLPSRSTPTPPPTTGPPEAAARPEAPSTPLEAEKNAAEVKSHVEAQFQLHLFEQDLANAGKGPSGSPPNAEARSLYVQAHAAFDRGDYPEAFRLSLRGRRQVGGKVETLGSPTSAPATVGGRPTPNPIAAAEEVAAHERCPACGHPTMPGETFCRGCGAARGPSTCPACDAVRVAGDAFCGKCGARYP